MVFLRPLDDHKGQQGKQHQQTRQQQRQLQVGRAGPAQVLVDQRGERGPLRPRQEQADGKLAHGGGGSKRQTAPQRRAHQRQADTAETAPRRGAQGARCLRQLRRQRGGGRQHALGHKRVRQQGVGGDQQPHAGAVLRVQQQQAKSQTHRRHHERQKHQRAQAQPTLRRPAMEQPQQQRQPQRRAGKAQRIAQRRQHLGLGQHRPYRGIGLQRAPYNGQQGQQATQGQHRQRTRQQQT